MPDPATQLKTCPNRVGSGLQGKKPKSQTVGTKRAGCAAHSRRARGYAAARLNQQNEDPES